MAVIKDQYLHKVSVLIIKKRFTFYQQTYKSLKINKIGVILIVN